MRIVLASSEAVPFAKTGGLADVVSALAKSLSSLGHQVWVVIPHYPQLLPRNFTVDPTGITFPVAVGPRVNEARVLWSTLPGSSATVLLVDQPAYFNRSSLYQEQGRDYGDNCERFCFFSRAVVELCRRMVLRPDVLHANDWQTGLIPALLKAEHRQTPGLSQAASVFTIHNMAFQGRFWHWDMVLTGLDWKYFNWRQLEAYEQLNLLKGGIAFADRITTVSPTYAREIQTPEFGCGLHGVLAAHRDVLSGILNGVDTDVWNPATDPALPQNYTAANFTQGKAACKAFLQQHLGLPVRADVPLFGMVSRLTDQKGLDILGEILPILLQRDYQFAIVGTGDRAFEQMLIDQQRRHPDKIAVRIAFDELLSHRVEAGIDLFLMPSRYEPCGLNQMYSLIYGSVPIVRRTGGLADSVVDASPDNIVAGTATGFSFQDSTAAGLQQAIDRAVAAYGDQRLWSQLVKTGMSGDWSWSRSARQYLDVYEQAVSSRRVAPAE